MAHIERSALVAFSAEKMFALVNDIAAYPQYMEGCKGAEILEKSEHEVVARLDLSKAGISHSFVTRNKLTPPESMTMALEEGPFSRLQGEWRFQVLAEDACKVSLQLDFEFSSKLIGMAAGKWFESVANQLVDGLVQRAQVVYG
ncbi:type II toxin-antitoxin system RatA family toxin [Maricurvus nonylphenolicus]|uniref:type II toxin-antitoxin system RatA family toxin n=1 Tax=Maricurvus nonylphenolicus TaxID=1008307 RepID=UPI0036F1D8D0